MKCPHCLVDFHDNPNKIHIGQDVDGLWTIVSRECPNCKRLILQLVHEKEERLRGSGKHIFIEESATLFRPKAICRTPLSPEVPQDLSVDYMESCLVLALCVNMNETPSL